MLVRCLGLSCGRGFQGSAISRPRAPAVTGLRPRGLSPGRGCPGSRSAHPTRSPRPRVPLPAAPTGGLPAEGAMWSPPACSPPSGTASHRPQPHWGLFHLFSGPVLSELCLWRAPAPRTELSPAKPPLVAPAVPVPCIPGALCVRLASPLSGWPGPGSSAHCTQPVSSAQPPGAAGRAGRSAQHWSHPHPPPPYLICGGPGTGPCAAPAGRSVPSVPPASCDQSPTSDVCVSTESLPDDDADATGPLLSVTLA